MDETSAIARKLQNYHLKQDDHVSLAATREPGILKNLVMISLMATAVFLTQITFVLIKWTKALER